MNPITFFLSTDGFEKDVQIFENYTLDDFVAKLCDYQSKYTYIEVKISNGAIPIGSATDLGYFLLGFRNGYDCALE